MCGIFAFIGAPPQRNALLAAMESVRHRGQCGFGFWLTTGTEGIPQTTHCLQTGHGAASLAGLALDQRPSILISHWRYSTRGEHLIQNCQPITIDGGNAVIAHNGQLELGDGFDQGSVSDTYRLARLIEKDNSGSLAMRIKRALHGVSGAAALVGADQESMVAAQDNFAIRPLFYGSYPGGCAVASEVPALSLMGVGQMREVRPGEIVTFSFGAPPVANSARSEPPRTCAFEYIYFHSSGGTLHGDLVSNWRYRLGIQLALEAPVRADIVTAVPKSGRYVASGYADGSGRELQPAVLCDEDSFRTFIERSTVRHQEVVRKYTIDSRLSFGLQY